ncbi:MAG: tetratricopeptide repeat protein [Flavobacteriales bacterium]|nr:tetratricopeptide repeat protein [Flavobacteriales bacterium]MDG1781038.1 tetratricopeptide repeat protein [Flavobacteriales bacterium]
MKKLLLLLLFIPSVCAAQDENWEIIFDEANTAYENGNFEEAYLTYTSLAKTYSNFELYFNTGNAAYKANKLGESILYYERAKKINPTDADLLANLAIANSKIKDRIEELPNLGVEDAWGIVTATKRLTLWTYLTLILTFVGLALAAWGLWSSKKNAKRILFVLGCFVILVSFLGYGLARSTYNNILKNTTGIILAPKVDVKTGPNSGEKDAFLLHEGTKVNVLQETEGWVEIKLANGNIGWVLKETLELV